MVIEFIIRLFIIGLTIFGGGPVFIPVMKVLFVNDLHVFNEETFSTVVAIVTALPGPVGPKIAGYAGFLLFGPLGLLYMFIALVIPATTIMVVAFKYLDKLRGSRKFKKISTYINVVCVGIFISIAYSFLAQYINSDSLINLENISMLVLFAVGYILIDKFKLDPMYAIIIALIFGGITTVF